MNIKIEQIQLRGNRILVKPDPVSDLEVVQNKLITATGKQLTNGQLENKADPPTGVIVAIGPDVKTLQVGDRVLYSGYAGFNIEFMLENYLMMSEPEPAMTIKPI